MFVRATLKHFFIYGLYLFKGTAFNAQVLMNDGNGDGNKDRIRDG